MAFHAEQATGLMTEVSCAPGFGNVPRRCGDGQVERLAAGYEDVLVAVVVERLPGESAIESS